MEKTPFYRNKAFWTLVASIIAALAAYFTVSCSYSQKLFRHGVHHDTVKIESTVKSRNFNLSCLTTNPGKTFRSLSSSTLELSMWKHSLQSALIMPSTAVTSLFDLCSRIVFGSKAQSMPLLQHAYRIILPSNKICSTSSANMLSTSSESQTSFPSFSVASLVLAVPLGRSRRGGRGKGKPRPKVKNIIIGGRHL